MKSYRYRFENAIILGCTLIFSLLSGSELLAQESSDTTHFRLIWADEFDGSGNPSTTKWERQEYNRRNNNSGPDGWWSKQDVYLDGNGNLVIRLRKIADKNNDGDSCDFSVGMIRSKGKFEHLYGRYEISCKLPSQPGWWVAFWMMQGDVGAVGNAGVDGVEVDIMEGFGWTNKINYAFHWDGYGADHQSIGKQLYPANIREGFHTFTLDWTPEIYIFYLDGVEKWRTTGGGICDTKGYIKVTGEISTEDWAISQYWANNPAMATYPDSFLVDYVRVYDFVTPMAIPDPKNSGDFNIYPNPSQNRININWESWVGITNPELEIFNSSGTKVLNIDELNNNTPVDVSNFNPGLYLAMLRFNGEFRIQWFMKN
jgi:beta-glucanase (GH16 family)